MRIGVPVLDSHTASVFFFAQFLTSLLWASASERYGRRPLLQLSLFGSTVSRKNFTSAESFIDEPDSRAQCAALEDNVKEFGLTYFGMTDKRHGSYELSIPCIVS